MDLFNIFIGSAAGSALIVTVGLIFRESLSRFINSSLEFRFAQKIETLKASLQEKDTKLQSDLSSQDQELGRIASFLISQKQDRDSIVLRKRIDAAETVARACQFLARSTMAIEMVKVLRSDFLESASSNKKAQESFEMLSRSMKLNEFMSEFAKLDPVPGNLYLPDRALQCFKAYQTIVMHAVTLISLAGLGQDSTKAMKKNILRNAVVPLAPNSKEGFDRFGDEFGFHWA